MSRVVGRRRASGWSWTRRTDHAYLRDYVDLARPFTLVAPALGFISGALTAVGAAPREPWSPTLLAAPLLGSAMAALLNAGNNALNQIYDLEIDRVNKPRRPLPSGRLTIAQAWRFTIVTYALALVLAWLVGAARAPRVLLARRRAVVCTYIYSVPPLRTKRLGIWANVTIAIPRGVLLKVAGWSSVKTIVGSSRGTSGRSSDCSCSARPRPRTSPTWRATGAAAAARCRFSTACAARRG